MATDGDPQQGREWLVEQRYRAVLEVLDGAPVSEVAVRYGVSRQAVYACGFVCEKGHRMFAGYGTTSPTAE